MIISRSIHIAANGVISFFFYGPSSIWKPTPIFLPGKSLSRGAWWAAVHGVARVRHDLVTKPVFHRVCTYLYSLSSFLDFIFISHFSLSCIGEGNGNPRQCSCLENPRAGGAWWAAIYGVAQSWTRLKRLSSSSSSTFF